MILPVSTKDLPSGGYHLKEQRVYDLHPATFRQMMKYDEYPSNTYIQRVRRDLLLLKDDIPDLSVISLFDLDGLIFLKKLISISKTPEVTVTTQCQHCGSINTISLSLDDMTYKNISKDALDIDFVEINGTKYPVRIPGADYVLKAAELFHQHKEIVSPKIFLLCCILGFNENYKIKQVLESSTLDDILLIDKLYTLLSGASKLAEFTCKSCNEKGTVEVNEVSTDMFRDLRINCELPKEKIIYSKRVRN